jgi:ABC-type branched-subunit amino acid transport system substrate-binding protein
MRWPGRHIASHACGWALAGRLSVLGLLWAWAVLAAGDPASPATQAQLEASLRVGERLYREGMGADGMPIKAVIAGDIQVDGRMFSCVSCHQRSGLGSVEGTVVTWPINGRELFAPRRRTGAWDPAATGHERDTVGRRALPVSYQAMDARPAYTAASLARAIRTGVAADGRTLSPAMPRYRLDDGEMDSLIRYLQRLSEHQAPGIDGQTVRFATVVSEGVPAAERDAMLGVLQAIVDIRNTQTRPYLRRASQGPFYKTEQYGAYRRFSLDVWSLTGPPESWPAQLAAYYRSRPVFALLGGISEGSWAPVHSFCEEREIPCIFPLTDHPVVSESDWYTLYFSKGLYQEGEAAARFLRASGKAGPDTRIVQVYRRGSDGEALARGFRDTWLQNGGPGLTDRVLETDETLAPILRGGGEGASPPVVLLWLEAGELVGALGTAARQAPSEGRWFASGSLLAGRMGSVPAQMRNRLYLTYPMSLPGENKYRLMAVRHWLKRRGLPDTNLDVQAKMYFLGWMLPAVLRRLHGEYYRDYFLETLDMMPDQDAAIGVFPRLSFGPGQRYASKGCYIVQLSADQPPQLVKVSDWVNH